MKKTLFLLFLVLLVGFFHSSIEREKVYAASTTTQPATLLADIISVSGDTNNPSIDGVYDNNYAGFLNAGWVYQPSNIPKYTNVLERTAIKFDLGPKVGAVNSALLELTVSSLDESVMGHTPYIAVCGSADDSISNSDGVSFPFIDCTTKVVYNPIFTSTSPPQVAQDSKITIDVTNIVNAFTSDSDRNITFVITGNESDNQSGRFYFYSNEFGSAPKLNVAYNYPPTGSFTINQGSYTNTNTVNLTVAGSDPDAGDSVAKMRFTENTGSWPAWEPYSTTKTFTLSGSNGPKTIHMQLMDNDGAISTTDITQSITQDTVPPTGTANINAGAANTNSENVTLSLSSNDNGGSGVSQMRFSNNNSTWSGWEAFATTKAWTMPAGDGTKTVYVQFKDVAGNISSTTISDSILLDKTPPTGTVSINGGAVSTNSTGATLSLTSSDGGAGGVQMRFSNDNSTWTAWEAAASTKAWNIPTGEGLKTVYVQYRDAAGNVSSSLSTSIMLDTIAPIVTGVANNQKYNSNVTIGYNEGTATMDGAAYTSGASYGAEGVHTLVVTDSSGNTTMITFTIDKTAPTGTLSINGGAVNTNNSNVMLMLTSSDAETGVSQMRFSNDNSTWSVWESVAATKSWIIPTGDGLKTVYVQFRDAVGNISSPISKTVTLDTAEPTGTLSINGGVTYTNNKNVTLSLTSDDGSGTGVSQMRFSNDNSTWSVWESAAATKSWIMSTGDGLKTVYVQYRDAAGNISSSISKTIILDTVKPTGTLSINGGVTYTNNKNVTLSLTSDDGSGTGVTQMQFSNDNTTWSGWESVDVTKTWMLSAGDGLNTVYVRFKDAAGNISAPVSETITLDTAAPMVGLNSSAQGTSGTLGVWLYNNDVTLTFNEGTAKLDGIEISSGTLVSSEGAHTLVVTDAASNVTTAQFIIDKTSPNGTIMINSGSAFTKDGNVLLTLTGDDGSGTGVTNMQFSNDNSIWSGWETFTGTKLWTLPTGDGLKTVYFQVKDDAGNISSSLSSFITLDTTAPTGTLSINSGAASTTSPNVSLNIDYTDGTGLGVTKMRFSNDGTQWTAWENSAASKSWILSSGFEEKEVFVQFQDAVGNESSVVKDAITFRDPDIDTVANAKTALAIGYGLGDSAKSVTSNLTLPSAGENGTTINWSSSSPTVIATNGTVTRPVYSKGDQTVTLTATITKGLVTETKTFTVIVKALVPVSAPNIEPIIVSPENVRTITEDGKIQIKIQDEKTGEWKQAYIVKTQTIAGYLIIQSSFEGTGLKEVALPSSEPKVIVLYNDKPYLYLNVGNNTESTKEWKVKFSISLLGKSVNPKNITVRDAAGKITDVKLTLSKDGKTVRITPITPYKKGELFYLTVANTVGKNGKKQKTPIRKIFIVE